MAKSLFDTPHIRTLGADPFAGVGEQLSNDLVASLNVYSKSLRDRASLGAFLAINTLFAPTRTPSSSILMNTGAPPLPPYS